MEDLGAISPFSMAFHQKGHDPKRLENLGLQGAIPVSGEVSNLRLGKTGKKCPISENVGSQPCEFTYWIAHWTCFFWNADVFFKSNRWLWTKMDLPIIPRDSFFSRGAMLKTATIGSRGQLELCKDFPQQSRCKDEGHFYKIHERSHTLQISLLFLMDSLRRSPLVTYTSYTRWWFQICFIFTLTWGNFPIWLRFFKLVETTN